MNAADNDVLVFAVFVAPSAAVFRRRRSCSASRRALRNASIESSSSENPVVFTVDMVIRSNGGAVESWLDSRRNQQSRDVDELVARQGTCGC